MSDNIYSFLPNNYESELLNFLSHMILGSYYREILYDGIP